MPPGYAASRILRMSPKCLGSRDMMHLLATAHKGTAAAMGTKGTGPRSPMGARETRMADLRRTMGSPLPAANRRLPARGTSTQGMGRVPRATARATVQGMGRLQRARSAALTPMGEAKHR